MRKRGISFVYLALNVFMHLHAVEQNPFADMAAGKSYLSYIGQLHDVGRRLDKTRPDEWLLTISRLREAGKTDLNMELEARLLEIRYRQDVEGQSAHVSADEQVELAARAGSSGHIYARLRILFTLFSNYRNVLKDFESAIGVAEEIVATSSGVDEKTFPCILRYYAEIGELCWLLGYYDEMQALMTYVTRSPHAAHSVRALALAYNYMGLYNLYQKRYDDAEHMFRLISHRQHIASMDAEVDDEWAAIAEGNVGYVLYKRGEYEQSVPYLKTGLEGASKGGRGIYAACKFAVALGDICVNLNRLDSVEYYIREAERYNKISPFGRHEFDLWILRSEYNFALKQEHEARAALDSALEASYRFREAFNLNKGVRFSRGTRIEKGESTDARFLVSLVALVICLGGYPLYHYYRKKRVAAPPPPPESTSTGEYGELLFNRITQYMEEEKIYLQADFNLKKMSCDLGINRSYLSSAINTHARCNFRTLVNNYRVLEAIGLLEKNDENNLSIEAIGEKVGFPDRFRFYRVFKDITKSSPMQYLNQRNDIADNTSMDNLSIRIDWLKKGENNRSSSRLNRFKARWREIRESTWP
ncbi:MAG: helix-turn-helix domain-containing protein [Mediterranea sp.]|jgi:AraC-like DNA-binding protein|nr:helix-turn-helix domain-containing protein [Mediterranea sp.]